LYSPDSAAISCFVVSRETKCLSGKPQPCAFDRDTPLHVKTALMAALAYFVLPFDAVPDILLVMGLTDDAAALLAALRLVTAHIRPVHREAARAALARMKESAG
jgi:uncharacterized membrane protein YkvA (DUF1232 family)